MTETELTILYLQIALLTIFARIAGELSARVRLPMVIGEIAVGIILGPTVLQQVWPHAHQLLFPTAGHNKLSLGAISVLGISMFLLAAGMELDLKLVKQELRRAIPVSMAGILLPFLLGFAAALWLPPLLQCHPSEHPIIFALFIGTALSISSLSLMSRMLIDLDLFKTGFGMLVVSAAVFDDIVGWTIAGVVFSLDTLQDAGNFTLVPALKMISITVLFVALMLTVGRWFCDRALKFLYQHCVSPAAVIGFVMGAAALGACFTQMIGIHGLFGAFVVGVVVGGSPHFRKETRESIESVVANFMAPLYFAAIGLSVNFVANFSWDIVLIVLAIACIGKILGGFVAARLTGLSAHEGVAIGVAMNSRGGIEIVLGMMALQEQIIDERMFVALAVMALITCATTGRVLRTMAPGLKEKLLVSVPA